MTVRRLTVFAREPVPGAVKTRLAAALGVEAAARLYAAFLADLAAELAAPSGEWESVLAHTGEEAGTELARLFGRGFSFAPQGDGDLGARLVRAFDRRGAAKALAVVVGSDAPTLSKADLARAFAALAAGSDVVLAPAPDGGYSLVGLGPRAEAGEVFAGVRWSTADALADTLANASRRGLVTTVMDGVPDVDVAEDLVSLRALLAKDPRLAPATRHALGLEEPPARGAAS
ncbi:MAG TPA: TIGR04282 family arsenosugar biosynthesis glycosyltransferase [Thermoanaerobaculia bacterium]|nr:TIGR04282 family arsenosugar biosynthesis glycosyltransferase [Thermoanaerobaculia bacterium]